MKIGNYSIEEYKEIIRKFHGSIAPGMIAGGIMADYALRNLPEGEFFDVICETRHCLVDAVQILTPCSVGNGWLKIVNTSRFAVIFYNKYNGDGIRVFIDIDKLKKWDQIRIWYFREIEKHEQDTEKIINQLVEAGNNFLGKMKVKVKPEYITTGPKISDEKAICPSCNEGYYKKYGEICPACQGKAPYDD